MTVGRRPARTSTAWRSTVWELLTGEAPFAGADVPSVLVAKLQHGLPSVRVAPARPPRGRSTSCWPTAGAADPEDRFASMADMLLAWRQAVGRARRRALDRRRSSVAVAAGVAARHVGRRRAGGPQSRTRVCGRSGKPTPSTSTAAPPLVDQLAAAGRGRTASSPWSGPSGSGKSSLVHAGLVPRLRDDDRSLVASMVPGAHPLDELSVALSRVATRAVPLEPGRLASERGHRPGRAEHRPRRRRARPRGRPARGAVDRERRGRAGRVPRRPGRRRSTILAPRCGWWRRCGPTSSTGPCRTPSSARSSPPARSA